MRRTRTARIFALVVLTFAPASAPGQATNPEPKPGPERKANRLAQETSPYLLQHAHNPVDWYPWGPEAFEKARKEGKPIFLSIGYSACYWCHVMERESFEDPAIAAILNEHFVAIKVDREERPDIDQVYMTALQALSGGGGWPMSMFLMPDGRPFFGGTYFPPRTRNNLPGFTALLRGVLKAWNESRPSIEKDAQQLADVVRRVARRGPQLREVPLDRRLAAGGVAALGEQFDPEHGGFGYDADQPQKPKFPEPVNLEFLIDQHRRGATAEAPSKAPLAMVQTTLDHLARGGVRDHLGGGYHRYSVDRAWQIPHFEKMLYDNAQLLAVHALAYEDTKDERHRREAADTRAFLATRMITPEGLFTSALDAETNTKEGLTYVWTRAEVEALIPDAETRRAFERVYGLDQKPNFEDEAYVLVEPTPRARAAQALGLSEEALEARLAPARAALLVARDARPQPRLDDKVLTSWNGLTIGGLAEVARVFGDDEARRMAERAADALLERLKAPDGRLWHTYRAGQAKQAAFLEDYAYLADGLLRLHRATGDRKRLDQARTLVDRMIQDFGDPEGGFYFTANDHESLLARFKDPYDGAQPSPNGVAIRALVALGKATGESAYLDRAKASLEAFAQTLADSPASVPTLLLALEEYLDARAPSFAAGDAAPAPPVDAPGTSSASVVKVAVEPAGPVRPRGEVEVAVILEIADGWHVNANPAGTPLLVPTTVRLAPGAIEGVELAGETYPEAHPFQLEGQDKPIPVYEGRATVKLRLAIAATVKPGPLAVPLVVRYQACDDKACLAPSITKLTLTIPVEAP